MNHIVELEKAHEGGGPGSAPSAGPVYRSVFAADGFPPPIPGLDSCWDVFRISVEKYPGNRGDAWFSGTLSALLGLTETCAGTFISLPNDLSMLGTVGPPVPNVDVCLESVPEMGYDALSSTPRGEVCIKGDTLFSGYHKREDLTEEVMVDGWFHTGDIGEWQPNGSLKIIDRKKNIFKLSQGEYVAVENLENIYGLVPDIDLIWIYGSSFESFLVAIINPTKQALERWAEANGISEDFTALCENPKAKEYIVGELTKTAKAIKLKGFEFVRAVHLDPVPFDMERDLLTPTYKKKRPQLVKYYQGVIDDMYRSSK